MVTTELLLERLDHLSAQIDGMQTTLAVLAQRQVVKAWYTTAEVAELLGKAEFTVREWCRLGRIKAEKRGSGRGKYKSWVVAHEELQRYQREALLPLARPQNAQ